MALYRKQPECIYCGESISGNYIPNKGDFVGDTFINWDYSGHNKICKHHPLNKKQNNMENTEIPRRARLDLMTPAELAIHNAMQEVEKMAADTRLTDAVNLLQQAKDKVADFVDNVPVNTTV